MKKRVAILALAMTVIGSLGLLLITESVMTINVWLYQRSLWPLPVLDGKKISIGRDWYPFLQRESSAEDMVSKNAPIATFGRIDTLSHSSPKTVSVVFRISGTPSKFVERMEEFPHLGRVMFLGQIKAGGRNEWFAWIEKHNFFVVAESSNDLNAALATLEIGN